MLMERTKASAALYLSGQHPAPKATRAANKGAIHHKLCGDIYTFDMLEYIKT